MQNVTVNKANLLDILRKNRERHRAVFLEALEGYRKQVIAELEKMIEEAKSGGKIRRSVSIVEPQDQTRDYDRVIGMLEMSLDETIPLDEESYQCYVLDQWNWSGRFVASNRMYVDSVEATAYLSKMESSKP